MNKSNIDLKTVKGFGDEWERFDQSNVKENELNQMYQSYFSIFPWDQIIKDAVGFDLGCGSGRWAKIVSPKVKKLICIDPSSSIEVAMQNLKGNSNCVFFKSDVDNMPIEDGTMDFGYSLGVLHHIPNTQKALSDCVKKLKPGAPFLLYLYYKFDNKPFWYFLLWKFSESIRGIISRLPHSLRYIFSQIIAITVYYPLSKSSKIMSLFGIDTINFPLNYYKDKSFYTMRTDSLDRFGTRLEQRFKKSEIKKMMRDSGLNRITFSSNAPYWVAVGYKQKTII